MLLRDFIEPAKVLSEAATLEDALASLEIDEPVFVRTGSTWWTVAPSDVVGYPTSRRLIDVPHADAVCMDADNQIERVLETDSAFVLVLDKGETIGRVRRAAVLDELAATADPRLLGELLQTRVLPALLHDFANSLGGLELALEVLDRSDPDMDAARAALRHTTSLLDRMRSLTSQDGDAPEPLAIASIVVEILPFLRVACGPGIAITLLDPGVGGVRGHRRALERAVLNLVLNASDAMKNSGRIEIELFEMADHVTLRVADDGPGVPAEHVPHLFDVGFTTNAKNGRGLGLASVRRSLARGGASVACVASPLGGAAFSISLPRL